MGKILLSMEMNTGRIIKKFAAYTEKKDEDNTEQYAGSTEQRNNEKEAGG